MGWPALLCHITSFEMMCTYAALSRSKGAVVLGSTDTVVLRILEYCTVPLELAAVAVAGSP